MENLLAKMKRNLMELEDKYKSLNQNQTIEKTHYQGKIEAMNDCLHLIEMEIIKAKYQ